MFEELLFGILLCVALVPLLVKLGGWKVSIRTAETAVVSLWLGVMAMVVWGALSAEYQPPDAAKNRPRELPVDGYVGSDTCRTCHSHHHATWHDSYHRTMTQVATPESVIGKFDNVRLKDGLVEVLLQREGDQFMADITVRGQGRMGRYPIVMTTGSHHMQAYWFTTAGDSRLLCMFPFMFLKQEQRWIPRRAAFLEYSGGTRPGLETFTNETGAWNRSCIKCHTTHGQPRPQFNAAGKFTGIDTRAAEFGIACEACHGPGEEHVRANRDPLHRYLNRISDAADPTIVNPKGLLHEVSSQVCGQCHGVSLTPNKGAAKRWQENGFDYRPGDDLGDSSMRFVVQPGCLSTSEIKSRMPAGSPSLDQWFWSDGMIRVSGREYNGLIESPCFESKDAHRNKMSCMSCHRMHQEKSDPRTRKEWANDQLGMGMESNQACVQCHDQYRDADRVAAHTHHASGSGGSLCYNCHMPHTTYGLMKAMRSHQVDSPSVKASLETGRPNACNQCHLDKTLDWTAEHLSDWYKIPKPKLSKDEREIAASVLWLLRGDAGQRALMAWSYGWDEAKKASGNHWQAPYLAQLLEDPYHSVRFMAHRSLRALPGFADYRYQFMGPVKRRTAARMDALALWRKSPGFLGRSYSRSILMDDQGRIMQKTFARLLKARNNRRIYLLE